MTYALFWGITLRMEIKKGTLCHFLDFLTLEDGTDRLTRNVGKELPLYAA